MSIAGEKKLNAVEAEIAGERAASLGRAGMRLRSAIDSLRTFDQRSLNNEQQASLAVQRVELVDIAADALAAYVVQWEAMGLNNLRLIATEYQVPPELWNRVGARKSLKN